jgi:hypothetical protein
MPLNQWWNARNEKATTLVIPFFCIIDLENLLLEGFGFSCMEFFNALGRLLLTCKPFITLFYNGFIQFMKKLFSFIISI